MIAYDNSQYPTGSLGWAALLEAIEVASPGDESDWIEFKANLDLRERAARPVLAKAIVAFANRDVARAARHLGGRALVVIGLAPGHLVGAPMIDPAELHDAIQPYLADPAPGWDVQYVTFKGKQILIITVNAPQPGDPIHCIAKDGEKVRDGEIYVRHIGQSAPAKSADLRMLSTRLHALPAAGLEVAVFADAGAGLPLFDYPVDWVNRWIRAERDRLMAPLAPPPPTPPADRRLRAIDDLAVFKLSESLMSHATAASRMADLVAISNPFVKEHTENRDPEEFKVEVEQYLEKCLEQLPKAVRTLSKELSPIVTFKVRNLTEQNFHGLEVRVHVEGDVNAYRSGARFTSLAKYTRGAPRTWGPWTETINPLGPDYAHLISAQAAPTSAPSYLRLPAPDIVNGGSANITFPPIDLRPHAEANLHELVIVAGSQVTTDVTCTWSATATNINGRNEGTFEIPLSGGRIDLIEYLRYGSTARPSKAPTPPVWFPDDSAD